MEVAQSSPILIFPKLLENCSLDEDWGRRKRDKPKVEESGANRVCYFEKATVLENQWQASENIEKLKLGYAGNISELSEIF